MKPITIHPGSALAGAAIIVLAGALSAQQIVRRLVDVRIVGSVQPAPHPRDFVWIEEGQPYAVPAMRIFVPTGTSDVNGASGNFFIVDLTNNKVLWNNTGNSGAPVPLGLAIQGGTVVSIVGPQGGNTGRLIGYLADA